MNDSDYIKECFEEAKKGEGTVSPNPLVGALIVKDGRIIGRGHHQKYGGPHAEPNAISDSEESVEGATLYCSLEPCCHTNKQTPPCTKLIIEKKIKRVVIANLDPNPEVAGKGVEILRNAGIEVIHGVDDETGGKLNEIFFKYITTKIPFVHIKMAQTLDGKIATSSGDSKWISDESARTEVHHLRMKYDAVMVGRNTLNADNPTLNIRMGVDSKGKVPYRIVVGNPEEMNWDSKILSDEYTHRTVIVSSKIPSDKVMSLISDRDIRFITVTSKNGEIDSLDLLKKLGEFKISSLLLEGGSRLASAFIRQGQCDRVTLYVAPKMIGNGSSSFNDELRKEMKNSIEFENISVRSLNDQIVFEGRPRIS